VLLFAIWAGQAGSIARRWFWIGAALLAATNVLFMVHGRTGYVGLAAISVVGSFQVLRWRGLALAIVLVGVGFAAAVTLSPAFKQRIDLAVKESREWDPNVPATTSVGMRLEFYRNTLEIIGERPLLGVGTGGFPKVYRDRVAGTERNQARHPHNQYLLTTAELGIVGLAALLFFFFQHGRASSQLAAMPDRVLARGLLALMLVGSLFNSLLLDHNEGVFFCWLTGLLFAGLANRDAPGQWRHDDLHRRHPTALNRPM
jgi:O-antigen ligase